LLRGNAEIHNQRVKAAIKRYALSPRAHDM
jgi:hypothetical protein